MTGQRNYQQAERTHFPRGGSLFKHSFDTQKRNEHNLDIAFIFLRCVFYLNHVHVNLDGTNTTSK